MLRSLALTVAALAGSALADQSSLAHDLGVTANQLQPAQPQLLSITVPGAVSAARPKDLTWLEQNAAGNGETCQPDSKEAVYFSADALDGVADSIQQLPGVHVSLLRHRLLIADLTQKGVHVYAAVASVAGETWGLFACRSTPTPQTATSYVFAMSDPNTGEPYGLQVDHLGRLMRCEAGRDPQGLGKILWTKQAYSGVIDSWEGSSVNDVFATGGYDEGPVLKLWRASSGTLRQSIPLPAWPVNVSIARDGSRVGALLEDGSVHIYDTVSGQAVAIPDVSSDQHVLALSGTGRYALLLQNGHDQIWNLDRGKVELTVPDEATGLEFTLDDHFVVWSTPQGLHSVVVGSGKAGPVVDGAAWNGALFTGIHPGEMVMVPSFGAGKVYRWSLEGQNAPVLIQSLSSLPVKTAPGIGADGLIIRVPHCDLSTFPQGK